MGNHICELLLELRHIYVELRYICELLLELRHKEDVTLTFPVPWGLFEKQTIVRGIRILREAIVLEFQLRWEMLWGDLPTWRLTR
jgi:hypothetical protein